MTSVGPAHAPPIITPPIHPTPILFSNSNIHSTVNVPSNSSANQKAALSVVGHGSGVCGHARIGKGTPLKTSIFKHLPKTITAPSI